MVAERRHVAKYTSKSCARQVSFSPIDPSALDHSFRSHLLSPGIASFSVMLGSNNTVKRNHNENAAIQSDVIFRRDRAGIGGSGFTYDASA
jgi:hypothetical protein